jgi:hypothetical protein
MSEETKRALEDVYEGFNGDIKKVEEYIYDKLNKKIEDVEFKTKFETFNYHDMYEFFREKKKMELLEKYREFLFDDPCHDELQSKATAVGIEMAVRTLGIKIIGINGGII